MRLSPNWPDTNETAVNHAADRARLLDGRTDSSETCLHLTPRRNNRLSLSTGHLNFVSVRHKWDETVYCEGFVVSYHAAFNVGSITDYNGFSQRRSREVDRVYLTFLFKVTLFNFLIYLIFILVLCSLRVH